MNCKYCGTQNNDGAIFCNNCGQKLVEDVNSSVIQTEVNTMNVGTNVSNVVQPKKKGNGLAVASIIIGVLSIILSFFLNVIVIPLAIVGLVLGIVSKTKGAKVVGILLNILAIILPIIIIVFFGVALFGLFSTISTYEGNGYKLYYSYPWVKGTLNGEEAFQYGEHKSYLMPLGSSSLTSVTDYFDCDFSLDSCKDEVYDYFSDRYNTQFSTHNNYVYPTDSSFTIFKDDLYYAEFPFGSSRDDITGKVYFIVSKDKNVMFSFQSQTGENNFNTLDKASQLLLRTIVVNKEIDNSDEIRIEKNEDGTNTIYDDDEYNVSDTLTNWRRYSSKRSSNLDFIRSLNGGWRILDDGNTYWVFKDNEFWWYKDENDLTDNYWYGNDMKIIKGKDVAGYGDYGYTQEQLDSMVKKGEGKVTYDDIYLLIMTPSKVISGGIDKSSTNIPDDFKFEKAFVIVNHGTEGLEGQMLDINTSEIDYYVKVKQ